MPKQKYMNVSGGPRRMFAKAGESATEVTVADGAVAEVELANPEDPFVKDWIERGEVLSGPDVDKELLRRARLAGDAGAPPPNPAEQADAAMRQAEHPSRPDVKGDGTSGVVAPEATAREIADMARRGAEQPVKQAEQQNPEEKGAVPTAPKPPEPPKPTPRSR